MNAKGIARRLETTDRNTNYNYHPHLRHTSSAYHRKKSLLPFRSLDQHLVTLLFFNPSVLSSLSRYSSVWLSNTDCCWYTYLLCRWLCGTWYLICRHHIFLSMSPTTWYAFQPYIHFFLWWEDVHLGDSQYNRNRRQKSHIIRITWLYFA